MNRILRTPPSPWQHLVFSRLAATRSSHFSVRSHRNKFINNWNLSIAKFEIRDRLNLPCIKQVGRKKKQSRDLLVMFEGVLFCLTCKLTPRMNLAVSQLGSYPIYFVKSLAQTTNTHVHLHTQTCNYTDAHKHVITHTHALSRAHTPLWCACRVNQSDKRLDCKQSPMFPVG